MNSRLRNCLRVLRFCRETALKRDISKLLLNGDILEESDYIDTEVYDATYIELERIYDAGIETVINLGNHDIYGELGGRVLHALRAWRKVTRIVEEPTLVWGSVQVVPWMSSPALIKAAIRNIRHPEKKCLVLHCGVQGAVTGPRSHLLRNPIKLRDIRSREFALILLSDYHTRQRLQRNPPVWYLGSPLQHSFGEIHKPVVWDVLLRGDGGTVLRTIETAMPRFRRVSVDSESELRSRTASFRGDYVKVSPKSDGLSDRTIERIAKETGFRLQIERKAEDTGDFQDVRSANFQSAMENYVEASARSEVRRRRLLKLGWRIFNGEGEL
jgi:DNA repair exonuclease SbcCD nuclease subunit